MISDHTNCLLYRVSRFSIPSWLTCWVHERLAALSNTFQRVEDLEATGVLTSSLQDKHVWTVLTTNKLLVFVCEPWHSLTNFLYFMCELWCSLITSYTFVGETCIFMGKLRKRGRELYIPIIWLLMTWVTLLPCWSWPLLTKCLEGLENQTWTWGEQIIQPLLDDGGKRKSWIWDFPRLACCLLSTLQPYIP